MKASRPEKIAANSPADNRGSGQLIYFAAVAMFACATVFGFCYPGSALEVASGQALPSNLLWFLASLLAALSILFVGSPTVLWKQWSWSWRLIAICFVACLALLCISTVLVGPAANYRNAINAMWQWVASAAIVFTVLVLYRTGNGRNDKFANSLLFLGLIIGWNLALYGCYQKLVEIPADIKAFETNPGPVLREAGVDAADAARYLLFKGRLYDAAPSATYSLTNNLAIILAVSLVLVASGFLKLWQFAKPKALAMIVVLGLPIALCLLWTKSRTAWLATVTALAWLAFINLPVVIPNRKGRRIAIGTVVLLAISFVGAVYLWDSSILRDASMSLAYRMTYWSTTSEIVAQHPWLGVASGNFQDYYSQFKAADAAETVSDPHSLWVETAACGGIIAAVLLVVANVLLVVNFILQDWRSNQLQSVVETEPQPDDSNPQWPLIIAVSVGSFAGWLLPALVYAWFGYLPGLSLYEIGLPATCVLLFCVHRFYTGLVQFASGTLVAVALTFLVSLSFSGGWMTPGVSNLWFVVLGLMFCSSLCSTETFAPRSASRFQFGIGMFASIGAILVLFYSTAWYPVRTTATYLSELEKKSPQDLSSLSSQDLVDIDPVNPSLWEIAAERERGYCMLKMRLGPLTKEIPIDSEIFDKYRKFSEGYIQRNGHSWSAFMRRANWQLDFAAVNNVQWIKGAIADIDRAVQLYPGDVEVLIHAALDHFLDGDYAVAERYLALAESIDKANVHIEQKIHVGKIYWPESFIIQIRKHTGPAGLQVAALWKNNASLWESGRLPVEKSPDYMMAEPLAKAMRKLLDAQPPTQPSPEQNEVKTPRE